jgi:RND family efflux transporter MFP subunit
MGSIVTQSGGKTRKGGIHLWKAWGKFRWLAIGGLVLVLAAGGYAIYANVQSKTAASSTTSTLQTAVARTGDLIIRASGAGTLISANEVNLGFQTSGTLKELDVAIGDKVTEGQVLAVLDTTSLANALAQAKQNLLELTSPASLATAKSNFASDQTTLSSAKNGLAYYISPAVLAWRERVVTAQAALDAAKLAEQNSPSKANEQAVMDANDKLTNAKVSLSGAQNDYWSTYLAEYFTTTCTDQTTKERYSCVIAPADTTIAAAQADYDLAKAKVQEDQYLITALTGGTLPENATGSGLDTLNAARLALQTAQTNYDNSTLKAPFAGTIMSINAVVGDSVQAGSIITLADLTKSDLTIYMDETDWQNVKLGYIAEATFDALPNEIFTGKVIQVYPSLTSIGGTTMIQGLVALDQTPSLGGDPLPLGVSASVDVIAAQAKNAVLVPVEALHELSTNSFAVFVMESGKPVLRTVEVGIKDLTYAVITSGLQAGETVTTGIVETK